MKTLIIKMFFVLFLLTNLSQAQDWIKDYPGIPIETELWWGWNNNSLYPGAIDSMREAGINVLRAPVSTAGLIQEMQLLQNNGFVIIPTSSLGDNWIAHYTDAKYSVWEAEGNPNYDVNLIYYDSVMSYENNNGTAYLKLRPERSADADTLIKGPYYIQDVHYYSSQDGGRDTIRYDASFRLKLERNIAIPDTMIPTENLSDTVCIIQVTQSYASTAGGIWHLPCTYVIEDSALTRSLNFDTLGVWKEVSLRYTLECDSCRNAPVQTQPPIQSRFTFPSSTATDPPPRFASSYIQFKVIWKKNPNYLLSIDKVTLSDQRGRELKNPASFAESNILLQSRSLSNNYNLVTGWLGVDEPVSIDIFEPIKIVSGLLDYETDFARPLYLPWMGMWDGAWENRNNPFGAMGKSHWSEFKKRAGQPNIIQDFYLYDYPYLNNGDPCYCEDYRVENINKMVELNYKQAYELDPNFGVSLQCGEIHFTPQAQERNNTPEEFLYNANLALMCGAKFLSLYTYFAQSSLDSCYTSGATCHGMVDFTQQADYTIDSLIYTEKYHTLRYKLNPRLKGLLGKTLKKLTPTEQYAGSNGINALVHPENTTPNEFIDFIEATGGEVDTCWVEYGYFQDPTNTEIKYFMPVNRYYSTLHNLKFGLRYLTGYKNWKLKDYVNGTVSTLVSTTGSAEFTDIIYPGDANLYSIYPVVKGGGNLIVDETVNEGTILYEDMTIESGATLTVNGTYYAKANITVKSGGKIVAGTNGKIVFDAGKKLIVDGIVEILGTSANNNLTITAGSEQAVFIKSGSALTVNYCTINAQHSGIETEPGSQSYVNISNTSIYAVRTGISLVGSTEINSPLTTSPSRIYKCNITTDRFYGISVANYSSILIKENTLNNCGISISNVASAFIQGNNISLLTGAANQPGIFFNNSGGYIRTNTIKNMANGIHLANSSPDIGGNILEDNYLHGLYIGSGSFPNMVGLVQTNPFSYYPLAGYNIIRNNGTDTRSGGDNDGSEIYFSYSDAHLGTLRNPGCNQISDDRTSTSTMNTTLLLGGFYGNEPHFLNAIYNYWGTTTPTNNRFGIAASYTPYYSSMCSPNGGSAEGKLVLKTSTGEVVDTISSAEGVPENPTALAVSYSEADFYLAEGNLTEAKPIYEQITQGNYTSVEKLPAFNKLYTIANLTGEDENYFNSLQYALNDIASTETDTLLKKIYNQNAIKCDVSKEEYITAINKLDNIIQENPNSEEAVYAEIDIITTALNLDTTNAQLGKIGGGKYLVKSTSDYLSKLNDILQSRFGVNTEEKEKIIPKEYSLYQNYPNPFNPTTAIKFDIPKDGLVQLEVFDILGRRITTLVNEYKSAGSYEHPFDASSLSSGVYIYKLQAGDFVTSKKMILLK